jgi:pSer/pThr/pTyr-binding forkhead associated (FHA) protein
MDPITAIRKRRSSIVPAEQPVRTDGATLTVLTGDAAGQSFELHQDRPTTLGRDPTADIVIDDPTVSRFHARITRSSTGHYMLEDIGSTYGTFVNDRRVQRVILGTGFRVQLGPEHVLRFALLDGGEARQTA